MSRVVPSLLLVGVLLLIVVQTAPAQDRVQEAREVQSFTEVALAVPGTLHLRQGESRSVEVKASTEVLDQLETAVEDGTLKIRDERARDDLLESLFGGDHAKMEENVDAYVTVPTIEGISLAGAGTVIGETPIEASSLNLNNAGSGEMQLEVQVKELDMESAGAGTFDLEGTADRVEVEIAGAGTVQAIDLTTETAEIEVAGAGDTRLHVTDELSANIIGSGDIEHRGSPTIETSMIGSGEVRSVEE